MNEQVNNHDHSAPRRRTPAPQTHAYRHSVGTNAEMHPDAVPSTTVDQTPRHKSNAVRLDPRQQSLASDVADDELEDEEEEYDPGTTRMPSSARRYTGAQTTSQRTQTNHALSPIPPRQSRPREGQEALINNKPHMFIQGQWHPVTAHNKQRPLASPFQQPQYQQTEEQVPLLLEPEDQLQRRIPAPRFHWLLWVGLFFCSMLIGYVTLTSFSSWLGMKRDDLLYGRPRTFQIDAVVGHSDSPSNPSHFQCINLDKQMQVIEFPGGNSARAKIYLGPTMVGPGAELTVCTLSFKDVNGDGKPDMILSIGGQIFVMINDGSGFRNVKQGEHITL